MTMYRVLYNPGMQCAHLFADICLIGSALPLSSPQAPLPSSGDTFWVQSYRPHLSQEFSHYRRKCRRTMKLFLDPACSSWLHPSHYSLNSPYPKVNYSFLLYPRISGTWAWAGWVSATTSTAHFPGRHCLYVYKPTACAFTWCREAPTGTLESTPLAHGNLDMHRKQPCPAASDLGGFFFSSGVRSGQVSGQCSEREAGGYPTTVSPLS